MASRRIKLHAAAMYKVAMPNATGLTAAQPLSRIKEVEEPARIDPKAEPRPSIMLKLIDVTRDKVNGTWTRTEQGVQSDLDVPLEPGSGCPISRRTNMIFMSNARAWRGMTRFVW